MPFPADDVHAVVDRLAREFGEVVLRHRRDDGRLRALHDAAAGVAPRGFEEVRVAADAGERLFDPLELADRKTELLADAGMRRRDARRELDRARSRGRERDPASSGEALHQHLPTHPGTGSPADDRELEREDYVVALGRAIVERKAERIVTLTEGDAFGIGRDEGACDTQVFTLAEQVVGVAELESEAENCRDRGERDVALLPVQADVELAVVALEDLAPRRDRARVRPGVRFGEGEGGDVTAVGEPREVVVFLRWGPVVDQELGRAERVRHHDRDRGDAVARVELLHDGRVRERAEAEPAVLLRDEHPEEFPTLEEIPHGLREVALLRRRPLVGDAADLLYGSIEIRLLFGRQLGIGLIEYPVEVGLAAEELAFDPDRARLDGRLLGRRDRRQKAELAHHRHDRAGERGAADRRDVEDDREHSEREHEPQRRAEADERNESGDGPEPQRRAGEAEGEKNGRNAEYGPTPWGIGEEGEGFHERERQVYSVNRRVLRKRSAANNAPEALRVSQWLTV